MSFDSFLKTFSLTTHDSFMIPVGALTFLLFWWLAKKVLFGPAQALVEEREWASTGSLEEAERILKEARLISDQIDNAVNKALFLGMKEKLEKLSAVSYECGEKLREAELNAQRSLKEGRRELSQHSAILHAEILGKVEGLAQEAASKILSSY